MTGPLRNPRHEKFTQALFEGKSAHQAYIDAGFKPCRQNASRLMTRDTIRERRGELQAETAREAKVTVASICKELDEANAVAKAKGQAAAMVSASALRAKLAGLMVDKVEVGQPGAFDKATSIAELVDDLLFYENPNLVVTDEDKRILEQMFKDAFATMGAFIDGLKAKMIDMPPSAYTKRQIELQRHGNGFKRVGHR